MDSLSLEDKEAILNLKSMDELKVLLKVMDIAVADKAKLVLAASLTQGTDDLIYRKAAYDGARAVVQEIKRVLDSIGAEPKRSRGRRKL